MKFLSAAALLVILFAAVLALSACSPAFECRRAVFTERAENRAAIGSYGPITRMAWQMNHPGLPMPQKMDVQEELDKCQ